MHELKVIQILDKSESNFKIYGDVILRDSETEKEIHTFISEAKRKQYREQLYNHIFYR